tara:strand:- start:740 stop:2137 length:1398 start_codon:yes stop_codon:yes gene_type:complete
MINKFFKTIHNRYATFFKFIFLIRYLFLIFFLFLVLLLIIPKFFDYEKNKDVFKSYLLKEYKIEVNRHASISFDIFPIPKIEINDAEIELKKISSKLFSDKIVLYPSILSIYNYDNFELNKLTIKKSKINIEISELPKFTNNLLKQKKKINLQNLNLRITNKNNFLFNLENISFSNFNKKNKVIVGKIFGKKFKINYKNNFDFINLNIPEIGLKTNFLLNKVKNNIVEGNAKLQILNSNLKFNFIFKNNKIKIFNSYFRNKYLSFNSSSLITLQPYFSSQSSFVVEDINHSLIKKINLKNIFNLKEIFNQLDIKNEILYKPKKFSGSAIDELSLKIDLAYGRLEYHKILKVDGNNFKCKGSINLIEEFPNLDFDCSVNTSSKKKILSLFSLKQKVNNEIFTLNTIGNLGILNKKINFKKITSNNYEASKEDLEYFKNQFEKILLDEDLLKVFNKKKIKEFILEIS